MKENGKNKERHYEEGRMPDVVISPIKVFMKIEKQRNSEAKPKNPEIVPGPLHLFRIMMIKKSPIVTFLTLLLSLNLSTARAVTCSLSDNGTKLTINGDTETSQETYGGNNICPSSLDYSSLQTIEFGKGIAVIDKPSSDWFMLSSAKSLYAPYVREIKDDAFHYSGFEYIDLPNVETVEIGALGASISNHSITYVNIPSSVYIPYDTSGSGDQIDEETLFYEAFGLYPSSCSQEDGVTTCGNCGDKFVKEGRGCVTDCGEGYTADSTSGRCNKNTSGSQVSASDCYASGQVFYQDACVDEYPFAKKHWTPAEANQWLYDENNMVILTFKVNR